jgi:small subunit ribosomal protein S3
LEKKRCVRLAVEKKFVQDGFKKAMIDEFFLEKLERAGYGGMDINRTPMGTQITIRAEKPGMIIGKSGKMIRKFTKDLDVRFKLDNPQIDVQEVKKPELNAQMMATRLANALERGWYFRKAGQSTLQRIMDSGAMGVEIVIAGKLTGPRKRTEKFIAGYIKHCGKPVDELVDVGYARAKKKLGIIGVKVRVMPPGSVLPDHIEVLAPTKEAEAKPAAQEVKPAEGAAAEVEKIIAESVKAEKAGKAPGQKPEEKHRRPRQRRRAPPRPKEAEAKPKEAPAAEPVAVPAAEPAAEPVVEPVEAPKEQAPPEQEEQKREE